VTTITKQASLFRGDTLKLFIINTITAIAYSFVLPVMSLFLIEKLQTPPAFIGIFTITTAVMSIVTNQWAGKLVDAGYNAKVLFMIALASLIITGILFSVIQTFWQAVLVGLVFFSVGNTCIPILLSMIRQHADNSGLQSTKLNAQMRSGVSLVWIVGPAISFSLIGLLGFSATYLLSAAIASVALLATWMMLPDFKRDQPFASTVNTIVEKVPLRFWVIGSVIFCGNLANGLYITAMPLFITQELLLPKPAIGILMGITAGLEIPAMLLAPRWSRLYGRMRVFLIAFGVGIVFYAGLIFANSLATLIILQMLNGLYFGIFVGLGISIMQDELPYRIGFASSFHTNAMRVGSMAGSSSAGLLAQFFGFHNALLGSLFAAVAAAILLFIIYLYFPSTRRQEEL
jgi:SET family sugar efflux transporter-like MFS transporter